LRVDQGGAGGGVAQQIWLAPETTEVVRAARWLQEIAPALQLDVRTLGRIDVCLEEMLTNAVCYGEVTGMIDVVLRRLPVRAVMVIADRGLPFNPLARPDASESGDLDSASDGGRGIRIVRQLTCASDYRRVGDVNRLTLEFGPLAPLSGEHPATVVGQDESQ
jgi:anti-sigma regulatory factor (Ser/Thr protein kinase)